MAAAQLVIGSAVGVRFSGVAPARVAQAMLLGAGGTLLMLLITLAFGGVLHELTGQPLALLLLAFIPGGLTEMSLIALGLGADPAFVVTHHCARVFLVVLIALPVSAWLRRSGWLGTQKAGTEPLHGAPARSGRKDDVASQVGGLSHGNATHRAVLHRVIFGCKSCRSKVVNKTRGRTPIKSFRHDMPLLVTTLRRSRSQVTAPPNLAKRAKKPLAASIRRWRPLFSEKCELHHMTWLGW